MVRSMSFWPRMRVREVTQWKMLRNDVFLILPSTLSLRAEMALCISSSFPSCFPYRYLWRSYFHLPFRGFFSKSISSFSLFLLLHPCHPSPATSTTTISTPTPIFSFSSFSSSCFYSSYSSSSSPYPSPPPPPNKVVDHHLLQQYRVTGAGSCGFVYVRPSLPPP